MISCHSRFYWLEQKKGTCFLNNVPVKILYNTKNYLGLGNKESKKMKFVTTRTRILIVSAVLILAIYIILPVSAEPSYYKASGTIDSYGNAWSAVIVGGHWSVTINEGVLQYTAMYHELNLDATEENSPRGSVDIFTYIFTTEDYELKGKTLTFSGEIEFSKVWTTNPDWATVPVTGTRLATITITPTTFYMDTDPSDGQDWDRYGTTTQLK